MEHAAAAEAGVEPLSEEFTPAVLTALLRKRRSFIKPVLLNQHVVVGIGNIYVDEALFRAGIHPMQPADELTEAECVRLHEAIVATLTEAVEAGGLDQIVCQRSGRDGHVPASASNVRSSGRAVHPLWTNH